MNTIKHTNKKISIIAPFFNEEESLPIFLEEVLNIIEELVEYNFEIIFIDDGSTDNSLVFLKEKAKENKNIIVLELSRNFGKEAALTAAINARDAKESGFPSASFTATLEASTALRAERKKSYELKIWGMRTSIGDMVTEKDRYNTLADYVDTEGVDL